MASVSVGAQVKCHFARYCSGYLPIRRINRTRPVRVLLFLEDGKPSRRAFGFFLRYVALSVNWPRLRLPANLPQSLQNQRPGLAARLISRPATPPPVQHPLDCIMAAVRGALSGALGSLIPGLLTRVQSPPFSFSSDVWRLHQSRSLRHEKNHPQSSNNALHNY